MSSACSSSYHRVMESLKRIDSEKKENNNEVGAWSSGAFGDSGEARLLYQPVNQTITHGKVAPLTNNPTPPYLLRAFALGAHPLAQRLGLGGKANRAQLRHTGTTR